MAVAVVLEGERLSDRTVVKLPVNDRECLERLVRQPGSALVPESIIDREMWLELWRLDVFGFRSLAILPTAVFSFDLMRGRLWAPPRYGEVALVPTQARDGGLRQDGQKSLVPPYSFFNKAPYASEPIAKQSHATMVAKVDSGGYCLIFRVGTYFDLTLK